MKATIKSDTDVEVTEIAIVFTLQQSVLYNTMSTKRELKIDLDNKKLLVIPNDGAARYSIDLVFKELHFISPEGYKDQKRTN